MPELPEVETIRRTLAPHLVGQTVREIWLWRPSVWRGKPPRLLQGRRVLALTRRGKHLFFHLDGGCSLTLHAHLGMTGRLLYRASRPPVVSDRLATSERPAASEPPEKHVQAVLLFEEGELHFRDVRRFGYLELTGEEEIVSSLRLGPEPLDPDFGPAVLAASFQGRRAPVKALLLDQRLLAGVGNIYADESLHRAGISPWRPAGELGPEERERLAGALREVLEEAIAWRGTTFSDYRDGEGQPGGFASRLRVYGREGEPCPRCGHPVVRQRLGGRGTYFCPHCQE